MKNVHPLLLHKNWQCSHMFTSPGPNSCANSNVWKINTFQHEISMENFRSWNQNIQIDFGPCTCAHFCSPRPLQSAVLLGVIPTFHHRAISIRLTCLEFVSIAFLGLVFQANHLSGYENMYKNKTFQTGLQQDLCKRKTSNCDPSPNMLATTENATSKGKKRKQTQGSSSPSPSAVSIPTWHHEHFFQNIVGNSNIIMIEDILITQ